MKSKPFSLLRLLAFVLLAPLLRAAATVVTTGQSLLANGTKIVVRTPEPDAGPRHGAEPKAETAEARKEPDDSTPPVR